MVSGEAEMKTGLVVIAVLLSLAADSAVARPQQCFLRPDVAVAINALGPYCSSPRGSPYRITHAVHYRPYWPFYGPYYYRFPLCWNWSSCYY